MWLKTCSFFLIRVGPEAYHPTLSLSLQPGGVMQTRLSVLGPKTLKSVRQ